MKTKTRVKVWAASFAVVVGIILGVPVLYRLDNIYRVKWYREVPSREFCVEDPHDIQEPACAMVEDYSQFGGVNWRGDEETFLGRPGENHKAGDFYQAGRPFRWQEWAFESVYRPLFVYHG